MWSLWISLTAVFSRRSINIFSVFSIPSTGLCIPSPLSLYSISDQNTLPIMLLRTCTSLSFLGKLSLTLDINESWLLFTVSIIQAIFKFFPPAFILGLQCHVNIHLSLSDNSKSLFVHQHAHMPPILNFMATTLLHTSVLTCHISIA